MTPREFVQIIRRVVLDRAIVSTIAALENPPGRRPQQGLVEASAWFHGLTELQRTHLRSIASMVAHQAIFGFFAVLDGVRAVEDGTGKGTFRLTYRKGSEEWDLTPPSDPQLHDILNEN